jgi:phage-related protein
MVSFITALSNIKDYIGYIAGSLQTLAVNTFNVIRSVIGTTINVVTTVVETVSEIVQEIAKLDFLLIGLCLVRAFVCALILVVCYPFIKLYIEVLVCLTVIGIVADSILALSLSPRRR